MAGGSTFLRTIDRRERRTALPPAGKGACLLTIALKHWAGSCAAIATRDEHRGEFRIVMNLAGRLMANA